MISHVCFVIKKKKALNLLPHIDIWRFWYCWKICQFTPDYECPWYMVLYRTGETILMKWMQIVSLPFRLSESREEWKGISPAQTRWTTLFICLFSYHSICLSIYVCTCSAWELPKGQWFILLSLYSQHQHNAWQRLIINTDLLHEWMNAGKFFAFYRSIFVKTTGDSYYPLS